MILRLLHWPLVNPPLFSLSTFTVVINWEAKTETMAFSDVQPSVYSIFGKVT
jgi:hypothetical protein